MIRLNPPMPIFSTKLGSANELFSSRAFVFISLRPG